MPCDLAGRHARRALVPLAAAAALLVGCQNAPPTLTAFGEDRRALATIDAADLPHGELVEKGKAFYRARDFGNAQVAYQKAVEVYSAHGEAWLGLAATYDQLGRFDQSDVAYRRVHELTGETSAFLNNRGYSYLLRGKVRPASDAFQRALVLDPGNVVAQNNLLLIRRLAAEQKLVGH